MRPTNLTSDLPGPPLSYNAVGRFFVIEIEANALSQLRHPKGLWFSAFFAFWCFSAFFLFGIFCTMP